MGVLAHMGVPAQVDIPAQVGLPAGSAVIIISSAPIFYF